MTVIHVFENEFGQWQDEGGNIHADMAAARLAIKRLADEQNCRCFLVRMKDRNEGRGVEHDPWCLAR